MQLNKTVTVLMPIYNAENYLAEALDSILNQNFKDYDILAINDGSTDNSELILHKYECDRLIISNNTENMGIVRTLNKGLDMIHSKYIVRMDSDDIAHPERIARQVAYMEKHSDIAVSGTAVQKFDEKGRKKKLSFSTDPMELKTNFIFNNPLIHPSVIIRNSVLIENNYRYSETHIANEDFGLWQNIGHDYNISNIDDILLRYRILPTSISHQASNNLPQLIVNHQILFNEYFNLYNLPLTDEDAFIWASFTLGALDFKEPLIINKIIQITKMILEHQIILNVNLEVFNYLFSSYYRINVYNSGITFIESLKLYKSKFSSVFVLSKKEMLKFLIKKISVMIVPIRHKTS